MGWECFIVFLAWRSVERGAIVGGSARGDAMPAVGGWSCQYCCAVQKDSYSAQVRVRRAMERMVMETMVTALGIVFVEKVSRGEPEAVTRRMAWWSFASVSLRKMAVSFVGG